MSSAGRDEARLIDGGGRDDGVVDLPPLTLLLRFASTPLDELVVLVVVVVVGETCAYGTCRVITSLISCFSRSRTRVMLCCRWKKLNDFQRGSTAVAMEMCLCLTMEYR